MKWLSLSLNKCGVQAVEDFKSVVKLVLVEFKLGLSVENKWISVELICRINRRSLSNYKFGFPNFSTPMRYKSFWKFYIFAQKLFFKLN